MPAPSKSTISAPIAMNATARDPVGAGVGRMLDDIGRGVSCPRDASAWLNVGICCTTVNGTRSWSGAIGTLTGPLLTS